jgi:pimeloyl-ACP methyl ester carboxylesterase
VHARLVARIHTVSITNDAASADLPVLVLVHGFGSGGAMWFKTFDHLKPHFAAIHALDWLGVGRSHRPPFPKNNPERAEVGRCRVLMFSNVVVSFVPEISVGRVICVPRRPRFSSRVLVTRRAGSLTPWRSGGRR